MKTKWRIATVGMLSLLPAVALAVAGWTSFSFVAELTPTTQGRFLVRLKAADNPSGCRNKDTYYVDFGLPGTGQVYRTLLEAVTADKQVRVYVTGLCDVNGYSEISSVGIVP